MRILRGLGGRLLPCGCLLGLYETYDGHTVATIDACDPHCTDATHTLDAVLDAKLAARPTATAADRKFTIKN